MQTHLKRCSPRIDTKASARKALLALLSLPLVVAAAVAVSQELHWEELQKQGRVATGTVLPPETGSPFHRLRMEGPAQGSTITVLTIDHPAIATPRYALGGQIRYESVEGSGYLELWNHFPDGSQYFSRTLADSGPMMKLQGTSGWRPFTLPFDATGAPAPSRLVFNVVLPGRGVIYLGPLQLVEQRASDQGARGATWMPDQIAGRLGGIAGAVVGSIGALIGILTSLGRARRLVTVATRALVVCGTLAFVTGVVALARSQPYPVYYPLLLIGFLAAVVPLGLLSTIRKRYDEIELRTMRAHDLG